MLSVFTTCTTLYPGTVGVRKHYTRYDKLRAQTCYKYATLSPVAVVVVVVIEIEVVVEVAAVVVIKLVVGEHVVGTRSAKRCIRRHWS